MILSSREAKPGRTCRGFAPGCPIRVVDGLDSLLASEPEDFSGWCTTNSRRRRTSHVAIVAFDQVSNHGLRDENFARIAFCDTK